MKERPGTETTPTFTIIVSAYNESRDIDSTCEALLQLSPQPEVLFVDDASTDNTADIIRRYLVRPSMRLIRQRTNRGVGATRNVGTKAATSDIVVFLDADVRLPSDFLRRLSRHYEQGADYVVVESAVANIASTYARFFQAQHQYLFGGNQPVGFSQGFSCRRSLALSVGLFTETVPGAGGGEDGEFARRLSMKTNRGVVDKTIVVGHVVPDTMRLFWNQWEGRGVAVPFFRRGVHHAKWPLLVVERLAAALWSFLLVIVIVPVARNAVALASRSERRWSDLPSFLALTVLQVLASRFGEWKGMCRLYLSRAANAR